MAPTPLVVIQNEPVDTVATVWPVTSEIDWCGQFETSKETSNG